MEKPTSTSKPNPTFNVGIALALIGAAAFSLKPVLIKLLYSEHDLAPEVLMTLRMMIATPIYLLVGWYMARKSRKTRQLLSHRGIVEAMAVGVLGYYCAALLDLLGLQYITAQYERMILFIFPTLVCLLGWWVFSEKPSRKILVALPLSYGGLLLIFLHDFQQFGSDVVKGTLLVLASAFCFSGYLLFSKPCINKLGSAMFTCIAMGAASIAILIHFLLGHELTALTVSWEAFLIVAVISIVATTLPSFLISAAIARIGSSRTSIVSSIGPVFTAALAVLLLAESFTLYHAFGMLMTLGGIIYLSKE